MFVLGIKKWEGKGSYGHCLYAPHLFLPFWTSIWVTAPEMDNKEAIELSQGARDKDDKANLR